MPKAGRKPSIFMQYFTWNLSLAVLSCAIVGLILFGFSIQQLNAAYEQEQLSGLKRAANDLSTQETLMSDIALDIRFNKVFSPSYFKIDATFEIEMVEQLANYQYVSPLMDQFFLLYCGTQDVYYPDHKSYFYIHLNTLGIREEAASLYEKFMQVHNDQLVRSEDGHVFFCYRIPLLKQSRENDAVLVFMQDQDVLAERIAAVTGFPLEDVSVYYRGVCIYGPGSADLASFAFENDVHISQGAIAACSEDGEFIILTEALTPASAALLEYFRRLSIVIIIIFALGMLLITLIITWQNYKPIRALTRRYVPEMKQNNNELDQLSQLLKSYATFREKDRETLVRQMEELDEQQRKIRRQFLLLLLGGNWDISAHETLKLPMPSYGLLMFRLLQPGQSPDALCEMIEELSGDDLLFYYTPLPDTQYHIVLVNLEDKATFSIAGSMLRSVLEANGIAYECLPGEVCASLRDLPRMMVSIFVSSHETAVDEASFSPQAVDSLMALIQQGDAEATVPRLEQLLISMQQQFPSMLIRRNFYATIYTQMVELTHRAGLPMDFTMDGTTLLTVSELELRNHLLRIACRICDQIVQKDDEPGDVKDIIHQKTMDYIDQHLLDYDLTLESVSKAMGISSRQVSRILRLRANMSYKEYVTSMRIERAKAFLVEENMSVAETSEKVCYASVSYFIKTFRQYVGTTPANFKLLERVQFHDGDE